MTALEALELIANGDLSDVDLDDDSDEDVINPVPELLNDSVSDVNDSDDETDIDDSTTDISQQQEAKKKKLETFTWKRSLK